MKWLTNWIEHQFLSGIRDSRKAGSLWGMMRGVGGVKKSIHQSLYAKNCRRLLKIQYVIAVHLMKWLTNWIEHQFLSGIRDSRKARSLWGMMRGVGGVKKSIHQSLYAKKLVLGLLWWGFKGVQVEIPSEEASTLQIRSVAFPPGQYTSPQKHPCRRLFDQDGHQDSSSPSL